MIEHLYSFDISLFVLINQTLANSFFDWLMPAITDFNHAFAFKVVLFGWVAYALTKGGHRGRMAVVTLLVAIVISDQVNSFLLKEWVGRLRPCHELSDVRLLVGCGGGKSFPSSHAVNTATAAIVLGFFYPRGLWAFLGLAFVIAYSRVYVGVHYPLDVIGGAALGIMWGITLTSLVHPVDDAIRRLAHRSRHQT